MAGAHEHASDPSLSDLLRSLVDDTRRLVRDEITLAKTEVGEKAHLALRQSILIVVGGVLAIVGTVALLAAVTLGLAHALTPLLGRDAALWVAPLLMGIVSCGIGGLLVRHGVNRMKGDQLLPRKTIESLRETGHTVADRFKSS